MSTKVFSAEYFTCVIEELEKKYNISLESDIIKYIYDEYSYENLLRQKYEKYNLFELMLLNDKYDLDSDHNKTAIIDTFIKNKIDIMYYQKDEKEEEHDENDMFRIQGNNIKWKIQKIRRSDYNIVIVDNNQKNIMEIHIGDIITIEDKKYDIYMSLYKYLCICEEDEENTMCIILRDIETEEEIEYNGQEFIDLFETKNVTYNKSLLLDWINSNK